MNVANQCEGLDVHIRDGVDRLAELLLIKSQQQQQQLLQLIVCSQ
jgi:hypothetical protein